jgi:prepilin peptidase CpaA
MTSPPIAVQVLLVLLVIPAAIWDFLERRVPNWLTFSGVLLGLGLNVILFESAGFWMALKGLGLALLIYFPLYLLRGVGGGDVKLMAAIGAIVGPANWLAIFVITALIGGVSALVLLAARGRLRKTFGNIWLILLSVSHGRAPHRDNPQLDVRTEQGLRLPHAVIIACGALVFLALALLERKGWGML